MSDYTEEQVEEMVQGAVAKTEGTFKRLKEENEKLKDKSEMDALLEEIKEEYKYAVVHFDEFNSAHEGYAVIKEELDELWDEVKKKCNSKKKMRKEALQIAAMGMRFIVDVCKKGD